MNITFRVLISILMVLQLFYGCRKEDPSEEILKPWKAPEVNLTEDVNIGAYYNLSFTDTTWLGIDALYLPTMGKYNSSDPEVIQQHLDWSMQSGIDFWICDHNSRSDSIIQFVFPQVTGIENIKLALGFSLAQLAGLTTIDLTDSTSIQSIVTEFRKMKTLFGLSNYLKIDDKPVVILQGVYAYLPRPASSTATDERIAALSGLRAMLKDSTGYDFYFIGNYIGWFPPDRYPDYVQSFDALTTSMFSDRKAVTNSYNENIDLAFENWKSYLDSRSVPLVPAVFPGRNDTITSQSDILPRSEEFFSDGCKIAKYYMDDDIRMVFINSFNNWFSGTQVEPADTYGNLYIEIIKNEFSVN